ncbi:MAG: hypothetical protein RLZ83_994 [Pseudomonadota bacterium]
MKHRSEGDEPFFIGWADTPPAERRRFLRAAVGLMAASAGLGLGLATLQQAPGSGGWDPDDVRDWRGVVTATPYPMLRTFDLGGGPRTALMSCLGKCGVAARFDALDGRPVVIRGSLIQRGMHAMIAVDEGSDWIRLDDTVPVNPQLTFPALEALGTFSAKGEILDSKCWFGAMRPASGKVHKACASLCIRGGIPPAFLPRMQTPSEGLMIMTSGGRPYGPELLELVADPVKVVGQLYKLGDLLVLDAPVAGLTRL